MNQDEKKCDTIRSMIRHENELISHRLGWLGAFQGLLFAALAFAWEKDDVFFLAFVVCVVGALIGVSIGIATKKANDAIRSLQEAWESLKSDDYNGPDIEGSRSGSGMLDWILPGSFIPWVFAVAWTVILFRMLFLGS